MKCIVLIMAVFIILMSVGCIDNNEQKNVTVPTPTVIPTVIPTTIQTPLPTTYKPVETLSLNNPKDSLSLGSGEIGLTVTSTSTLEPIIIGDHKSDVKTSTTSIDYALYQECIKTKSFEYCINGGSR